MVDQARLGGLFGARRVNAPVTLMWARSPGDTTPDGEAQMTTFDKREKAFENKFAHDQDLKFKAEARRNRMIAEWAAAKMGITGAALDEYIKAVRKADLLEKGHDDVVQKIVKDLTDKGIKVAEADVRNQMAEFMSKAVKDVESSRS
jgi:hypothetical protein